MRKTQMIWAMLKHLLLKNLNLNRINHHRSMLLILLQVNFLLASCSTLTIRLFLLNRWVLGSRRHHTLALIESLKLKNTINANKMPVIKELRKISHLILLLFFLRRSKKINSAKKSSKAFFCVVSSWDYFLMYSALSSSLLAGNILFQLLSLCFSHVFFALFQYIQLYSHIKDILLALDKWHKSLMVLLREEMYSKLWTWINY